MGCEDRPTAFGDDLFLSLDPGAASPMVSSDFFTLERHGANPESANHV
jgi:hypothetical protein